MGPDGFGPSGGDGGFGGGAGAAGPAGGHSVPVRSGGSPDGALVFGGEGERPGFELGTFEDDGGEDEIAGRSGSAADSAAGRPGAPWSAGGSAGVNRAGDGSAAADAPTVMAAAGSGSDASGASWFAGSGGSGGSAAAGASGAPGGSGTAAAATPDGAGSVGAASGAAPNPAADQPHLGPGLAGSAVTAARSLFGPQTVVEAVQVLAEHPDAVIIAGGTVAMPDITAGRRHPGAVLTLHRCAELRGWSTGSGEVLLHAGLTLAEMQQRDLRQQVPALNQAARTVGAPHIRAVATLGGNLVVGPASADLPVVLAALGASVLVASADGVRTVTVSDFYDRDGVPQLAPGELVVGARVPVVEGMQGFMKIGVRGGISRAILSIMLAVDPARRSATCVVGAMALAGLPSGTGRGGLPTLLRADHADRWLAEQVDWDAAAIADPTVYETFGRLVADSLVYGDGSGTLGGGGDPYRRKAVEICARRALLRALPPLGWLDQVRELQKRADFQRAKQRVERAEVERAEQARNQDQ
ncbi:FAD binding domain-containing protein [Catenulispora sp. NF23]|uniref:FAD binding domain-containing protein n=1 Tax=Catenulispora pinistramenti TaxID=2705254 RepID=UPI001BAB08EE|nr:FAD binding domain-containing protein [Catenulispora pinistramenti]MBS2533187.1 FAD binding domain-containing protein [Catenulispora pinistramenti]